MTILKIGNRRRDGLCVIACTEFDGGANRSRLLWMADCDAHETGEQIRLAKEQGIDIAPVMGEEK